VTRRKTRNTPRHPSPASPPAHVKGEGTRRYRAMVEARAAEGCPRHATLLQWMQEGK